MWTPTAMFLKKRPARALVNSVYNFTDSTGMKSKNIKDGRIFLSVVVKYFIYSLQ